MIFKLLCLILPLTSALPISGLLLPPPLQDSFYEAPDNLSELKHGEVYNSRQVIADLQMSVQLAEVVQIAYKTSDAFGNDSHTIATVLKPLITSENPALFSYQFWEDSAELDCSPSYSLVKGFLAPDSATATTDGAITIQFALSKGWYVVVPDHEGPKSAFIEGYTEGYGGLDGIRAAISYLGLSQDVPTVLYGYSGGASASVWMANLYESYAPELNIVGAAHGGTPVDIGAIINVLDNADNMFSGFIVGALTGLLNAYPDLNETAWPHMYDNLKNAILTMKTPGVCITQEILDFMHQEFHTQLDVDFWTYQPVVDMIKRESLLKNISSGIVSTPKFPRYIFHGEGDYIIPYAPVKQYVEEQCASGANIQFVPWKGDDHVTVEYLGIPDAYQFLIQAVEGTTPQLECGTASQDILTLGSTTVGDVIGQGIADLIKAVNDLTTPLGQIHFDINQPYGS